MIHRGGTMARLAQLLRDLDRKPLPIHVTPIVRDMIEAIAAELPRPKRDLMLALLKPGVADRVLPRLGPKLRGRSRRCSATPSTRRSSAAGRR